MYKSGNRISSSLRNLLADGRFLRLSAANILLYFLLIILAALKSAGTAFAAAGAVSLFISLLFFSWATLIGCEPKAPVCCIFLLQIGTCLQCVIGKNSASKLTAIYLVSACASAILPVLYSKYSRRFRNIYPDYILIALSIVSASIYLILLLFGREISGTKAWLYIGPVSLQLTELSKLNAIIFLAYLFSGKSFTEWRKVAYATAFVAGNALFLLLLNELGTLMVISFIYLLMCFLLVSSPKCIGTVFGSLAILGGCGYVVISLAGSSAQHKLNAGESLNILQRLFIKIYDKLMLRFDMWLRPETLDRYSTGYQSLKAREAVLIGGLFGSEYKVHVPVPESDFAFPSLILNFGLLMGIMVFILFFLFLYEGIGIYLRISDKFEQALCIGFIFCIVVQSFLMFFGSTNFFIMTGIPIAFLSAGGTATMTTFIMVVFIFYFSSRIKN